MEKSELVRDAEELFRKLGMGPGVESVGGPFRPYEPPADDQPRYEYRTVIIDPTKGVVTEL